MESPTDDTIPRPRIPTWLVSHMTWFWLALAVGGLLRLYEWNSLPPPIWGDEAGSAYEAYSLLKTGMDKWGNSWPAYFPAWGSGQSTLHAILSLPLIALFGLNAWTARIVNLVLALLTLPLLYHAVRLALNRAVALLSLWLLALAPWHLMLSRWSLDCNLLPFFILLGVFLLEKVRARPRCRWTYLVFIPWALGLYSYSLFVFYLPFLVLTSLWLYRDALFRRKLPLAVNLSASALVVSPFGLFILKNYVLKASLPFETWLPFDLPMLVSSRLQQINITYGTMLRSNLRFLTRHLQDDLPWNQAPGFPPLFAPILYLAAIGFFIALLVMIREKTPNVFFLWLACCAPAIFIYAYNINRANAIFIPIIVLAAYACVRIWESVGSTTVRYVGAGVLAVSLLIFTGSFVHFYFTDYRSIANRNFTAGLGEALTNAARTGGGADSDPRIGRFPPSVQPRALRPELSPRGVPEQREIRGGGGRLPGPVVRPFLFRVRGRRARRCDSFPLRLPDLGAEDLPGASARLLQRHLAGELVHADGEEILTRVSVRSRPARPVAVPGSPAGPPPATVPPRPDPAS